ncbi:MAG TPA: IS110 family transposase [Thermoanaerobaculia bacterium]|nr:IS110 family transposase [Thermoanaerobaculia bacterium]
MRVIRKRCLGLDLHKKQITAHLRVHRSSSEEPEGQDVRFGTMPDELEQMREWVREQQITDVVMESTGVYWMHVYELLEGVTSPAVVNASHVKKVPGRKTDMTDAQWLAELHAHGLLRLSFIPPKEIRELRAVTRYRTKLVAIRTGAKNRTIKLIEMAGVKLSSVVSSSFGKTGRGILDALCSEGRPDAAKIATLAKGTLRGKVAELERAVRHPLSEQQRELLKMHLQAYDAVDAQVAATELKLAQLAQPYHEVIELLDQIPGINPLSAITVLAETGIDMSVYRDASHLSALAGLAPGNAISADKRRRVSVRAGNRYLKRILVQIAWAASRKKDSFQRMRFLRLQTRIGRNKAIVAVARQILIVVYHVLSTSKPYEDRGMDFYDRRNKEKVIARYTKRLAQLGFTVQLTKKDELTQ